MLLGGHNGDVDSPNTSYEGRDNINDDDESYTLREATYNTIPDEAAMVEDLTWEVAPQLIVTADTAKTKDSNLIESNAKILTSVPQRRR